MSTNSILTYNQDSLKQHYGEKLDYLAQQYLYKKWFMIGSGVEKDEVRATITLNRILNSQNCELINYVADLIAGELESCGVKPKNKKLKTLTECCKETSNPCEFDKCNPRIEF